MATATVMATTAGTATALARPAQVVRRPSGEVVVILLGRDALSEAATWRSRGYLIDSIGAEGLGV